MIVALLVIGALGCLITGTLLEELVLISIALGASLAGLLIMVVDLLRRKRRRRGHEASEREDQTVDEAAEHANPATDEGAARVDDRTGEPADEAAPDPADRAVADQETVYVVQGRKRYHSENCDLIAGLASEEVTLEEASGEGFTPCTACIAQLVESEPA